MRSPLAATMIATSPSTAVWVTILIEVPSQEELAGLPPFSQHTMQTGTTNQGERPKEDGRVSKRLYFKVGSRNRKFSDTRKFTDTISDDHKGG